MYEQLSFLNQLGIKPEKEAGICKINYALPCAGCLCESCSNNVDCMSVKGHEVKEPCFNCDECYFFNGYGNRNKKYSCSNYIITNHAAEKRREQFRQVN